MRYVAVILALCFDISVSVAQTPVTIHLDTADGLSIDTPSGFTQALYSFGPVPAGEGSNGLGMTIALSGGEGVLVYGPTVETGEGNVHIRCSVRSSGPSAAVALVGLNAPVDGSLIANMPINSADFMDGLWHSLEVVYDPKGDSVLPAFQAVAKGDTSTTIHLDQIIVTPLSAVRHEEVARLLRLPTLTPTPTDTSTPTPTVTPTLPHTPTVTPTATMAWAPGVGIVVGTGEGAQTAGFQIFSPGGAPDQRGLTRVTSATVSIPVAAGDIDGDGIDEIIAGSGPRVGRVAPENKNGAVSVISSVDRRAIVPGLVPFPVAPSGTLNDMDVNPTGEIRVAAGNVMGGLSDELVMAQGGGAQSRFRISSLAVGMTNLDENTFRAIELSNPPGGVNIALGDIDGDGYDEIICGQVGPVFTVADGGPFDFAAHIQAINIKYPGTISDGVIRPEDIERSKIQATFGLGVNRSGAVRPAAGDLNGDGRDEVIVVSASTGGVAGGNRIAILTSDLTDTTFTTDTTPFAVVNRISFTLFGSGSNPSGNIYVAAYDVDGDALDEIIVGRGEGAANQVMIYDVHFGLTGSAAFNLKRQFATFDSNTAGGTHVAVGMFDLSQAGPTHTPTATAPPSPTPSPSDTPTPTSEPAQPSERLTVTLPGLPPNTKPLEMVLAPAGTFTMGSPEDERGRWAGGEWLQHTVTITTPFYLGVYEVTQAQWESVMGENPAHSYGVGADHPVYFVSWSDCQEFITRLNQMGQGVFRLPTEAEWEYACRAGTATRFSFGDALECDDGCAPCELLDQNMWWCGNASSQCYEVGLKTSNPWGFYDMHGNLYEWCSDWWQNPQLREDATDPQGPTTGSHRVTRGGDAYSLAMFCRSALRNRAAPDTRGNNIGLRLVREHP